MPHGIDTISLEDEHGLVVPSQVLSSDLPTHTFHLLFKLDHVPSLGYTVLHAVEGQHEFHSDLTSAGDTLENSVLRVRVDPQTGCITSLLRQARELRDRSLRTPAATSSRPSSISRRTTTPGTSIPAHSTKRPPSSTTSTK